MKRIRNVFGALAFVLIIGATQACTDSLTAPSGDEADDTECWWIKGTLHCSN